MKLLLIDSAVLPPVFAGVMRAKELLASGEASSASQAAKLAGISRSAYYKYKDSVFDMGSRSIGQIININAVLKDRAGVLSSFISELYRQGLNIVTINQGIPINGAAGVSVSVKLQSGQIDTNQLISALSRLDGVGSVEPVLNE